MGDDEKKEEKTEEKKEKEEEETVESIDKQIKDLTEKMFSEVLLRRA